MIAVGSMYSYPEPHHGVGAIMSEYFENIPNFAITVNSSLFLA